MAATTRRIRRAARRRRARAWQRVQRGGVLSALSASSLALPGMAHAGSEMGEVGIVRGLACVEIKDTLDRIAIPVGFHKHWMGGKIESVRRENHVIANRAGRLQKFV